MSPASRSESYRNVLVPPPPAGPSICVVCHRGTNGYERCYQCFEHRRRYDGKLADLVVPISLAIRDEQLARELGEYKYSRSSDVRKEFSYGLACVLATFLGGHERCLAASAGVKAFDLVTIVPGTRRRNGAHPLGVILGSVVGPTRHRFAEVMAATGENDHSTMRPDHITVHGGVAGRAVLLVDDTWTSGASLQSAAVALKRGGARRVAGLVVGRRVDGDDASARHVLDDARSRQFGWDVCVLCGTS